MAGLASQTVAAGAARGAATAGSPSSTEGGSLWPIPFPVSAGPSLGGGNAASEDAGRSLGSSRSGSSSSSVGGGVGTEAAKAEGAA